MKYLSCLVVVLAVLGCGDGGPSNVADGVEMSEVEQYRAMVEESQNAAAAGAEEAASNTKPGQE